VVARRAGVGALGEALNGLATKFNASQTAYKVNAIYKGSYPESMTAAIAAYRAKNPPHIVQVFEVGTATMMAAKGAIVPISKVMTDAKEPFDPKAYLPTVTGYYSDLKGNMLSFPFNSSTVMFYINKDAFKKAGLDPKVLIDIINAGSGRNSATQDKFPRAVLTRSFDFGFATGLSYKDVRLCIDEAESLSTSEEPDAALFEFFSRMVAGSSSKRAFADALAEAGVDLTSATAELKQELGRAIGTLLANESVMIRPERDGRITAIHFTEGQVVRKGEHPGHLGGPAHGLGFRQRRRLAQRHA